MKKPRDWTSRCMMNAVTISDSSNKLKQRQQHPGRILPGFLFTANEKMGGCFASDSFRRVIAKPEAGIHIQEFVVMDVM